MVKAFRIVGLLEGLSYLLLLGVGLPMKYLWGNPAAVKALGMPHGVLFLLYLILAFNVSVDLDWPKKRFFLALIASLLPCGTLVFDRKYMARSSV